MNFSFRIWASLVSNRDHSHSSVTRMCESFDLELNVPFTDYHLVAELQCSLLPWRAAPDAWDVELRDGTLYYGKVFPYAEWVECPECGAEVVNDDLDDHIAIRHDGEYRRFGTDTTRDEYDDR